MVLQVHGECAPCERMNEARPGLRKALTPARRAGTECSVVEAGTVRIGDDVTLENSH